MAGIQNVMGYLQRNSPETIQQARNVGLTPENYTDVDRLKSDIRVRNNESEVRNLSSQIAAARAETAALQARYEEQLNKDRQYTALAEQIKSITGDRGYQAGPQASNQALASLMADRNYGTSDLSSRLNFQVSNQQIIDDYNATRLSRLNQFVQNGNAQAAGSPQSRFEIGRAHV